MKKYIILILLTTVYVVLGDNLETHQIIIKPAYWALYGAFFGIVIREVMI